MGTNEGNETMITSVLHCARCGEDHTELTFVKFRGQPVSSDGKDYQYWGLCPVFREPILLHKGLDDEPTTP